MFSDRAIRLVDLSKSYQLYEKPHDRLKQTIWRGRKNFYHEISVLDSISFELMKGEALGIIGRNGAGKSTLLQLICGTLSPTRGSVEVNGRVSALLELGAGFNPEFTGRENVYMNAVINGLSHDEIDARFEDIAKFADIGDYIEQPVKTYSSGMYVRLAFAVATTIDPDVLIIDEALSVGDQLFQKKCINRMMQFKEMGKTILFCSHDIYYVKQFCSKAIWLHDGCLRMMGPSAEVINSYLAFLDQESENDGKDEPEASGVLESPPLPKIIIDSIEIADCEGNALQMIDLFQTVIIRIKTRRKTGSLYGHVGIGLMRPDGQLVFATTTKESGLEPICFEGEQEFEVVIPSSPFLSGTFFFKAVILDDNSLCVFSEIRSDQFTAISDQSPLGMIQIEHEWRIPDAS